jgi:Tol biopolymer transport system component
MNRLLAGFLVAAPPAYLSCLACGSTVTPMGSVGVASSEAGFAINADEVLRTHELGLSDTFSVALDARPSSDVTLNLALADEGEGTLNVKSLTFTSDDWETPRLVRIFGVAESGLDGDVEYELTFTVESRDPEYARQQIDPLTVINEDFVVERVSVPAPSFKAPVAGPIPEPLPGPLGEPARTGSRQSVPSNGGRYVVFETSAVLAANDTHRGVQDVYIHDRDTGSTTLLSAYTRAAWDTDEHGLVAGRDPAITPDGRYVSFISPAPLTDEPDEPDESDEPDEPDEWTFDIYVSDRHTPNEALERITDEDRAPRQTALSADGRFVAFGGRPRLDAPESESGESGESGESESPHAPLRYDRDTRKLDEGLANTPGEYVSIDTTGPALSADGKTMLFTYIGAQSVPGLGQASPVLQHHYKTGLVTMDGTDVDQTFWPSTLRDVESRNALSQDGKQLAFSSNGNVVVVGPDPDVTRLIGPGQWASLSADGRYLAFQSDNDYLNRRADEEPAFTQVYVVDLEKGKIALACLDDVGNPATAESTYPSLSPDGTAISFSAASDNLVADDHNGITDAFVVELDAGFWNTASDFTLKQITVNADGGVTIDEDVKPGDQIPR